MQRCARGRCSHLSLADEASPCLHLVTFSYEVKKCIGKGSYGSVYLSKNRDDGRHYVIKRISINDLPPEEREATLQEVRLLASLRNPFIVAYHESFFYSNKEGDEFLCIVMQYCEGGDLNDAIQRQKNAGRLFPEEMILNWFIQILLSLQYIHEKKILHRDLKTKNIFLTKEGRIVKVGDFGIARVLGSTVEMAMTVVGTPYYMSPELCQSKPYSYKSDIWALGCVLFELCSLRHAFDANNISGLVYKIMQGSTPAIPQQYSQPLRDLVRKMLSRSPEARPSANAILALPFVKSRAQELCMDMTSFGAQMIAGLASPQNQKPAVHPPLGPAGAGPADKAPDPRRSVASLHAPPPTAASRARTPSPPTTPPPASSGAPVPSAPLAPRLTPPPQDPAVAALAGRRTPVARIPPPEEVPAAGVQRLTPRQLSALRQQTPAAAAPAPAPGPRQASPMAPVSDKRGRSNSPQPRASVAAFADQGPGYDDAPAGAVPSRRLHREDEPLPRPGAPPAPSRAPPARSSGHRSGSESDGGDHIPGEEVRWHEGTPERPPPPPPARRTPPASAPASAAAHSPAPRPAPAPVPPSAAAGGTGYSDDEFETYSDEEFETYDPREEEGERASDVQAAAALLQRAANAPARPQSAREWPAEASDAVAAQARLVWREKAKNLRARAEQHLGAQLFERAYEYLRGVRRAAGEEEDADEREDQRVREGLARLVGHANMGHCFLVDQLIFAEMQYEGAF
eukprot:tig00020909_g15321.t1